jgi:hypothetical protein
MTTSDTDMKFHSDKPDYELYQPMKEYRIFSNLMRTRI